MNDDHPDPDSQAIQDAADRILKAILAHEFEAHKGGACLPNRLSAVAYLAHKLGLKSKVHLARLAVAMDEYDERCPCEVSRRLERESN